MHDLTVTLVAVATPPGRGGIGCVRISGPQAAEMAARIFEPVHRGPQEPRCARYGRFLARDGAAIDHGFAVLFPAGASFTGETTLELWPHGSPAVLAELVEAAVQAGAAPAGPGEFTYRALRHGRLDLARAEAVRDLVAARTLYQARIAFRQAEGALSRRLAPVKEALTDLLARGQAAVEFVEESETEMPSGVFEQGIAEALRACEAMLAGFGAGRVVREGAVVAIAGRPNVGKSSLFNRLLGRDRAIVAEQPGTTRDTLEELADLEGVPVRLVDSAGIRPSSDPVEGEGVRRAQQARQDADGVLLVLDCSRTLPEDERLELARLPPEDIPRVLIVLNKIDLPQALEGAPAGALRVSARTGEGIAALTRALRERLLGAGSLEDPVLTDLRHARAVERAREALERAASGAAADCPIEFLLEDVRSALESLEEITGSEHHEALYERIFSTFCIGK